MNTQWAAGFSGSIPETYHTHLGPLFFDPYATDLVARLALPAGAGEPILELAAGTGIATRHLRERAPERRIVATDLNEAMLDVARKRMEAVPGIEWHQADASALSFSDQSFDAVICQFGLMFVPDKLLAAREAFRVLRPAGQFLFNLWASLEENPLARTAHETIQGFFRSDPPDFYLVPFGFHDTAAIRTVLERAGFGEIDISTVRIEALAPSALHAATGLVRGSPVFNAIGERAGDPDAIVAAIAAALAKAYGDRPLRVPMCANVFSARRT